MEEAILAGDVAWHALPMTFHSEFVEPVLFRHGLELSRRLDSRFGRKTIAAKMTDVPGHTRAIVRPLVDAGVEFLHIGVNPASAAPEVPDLFRWRDNQTGRTIVTAYTKGGYGNLVRAPGLDTALYIAMTNDNHGPQTAEAVEALYAELQTAYPEAEILPGRMDDFAAALRPVSEELPQITAELGDTWIHGVGCDPKLSIPYQELARMGRDCLPQRPGRQTLEALGRFNTRLLLVPEHTWGLSEMTALHDFEHYEKSAFQACRDQENYRTVERAWAEKRAHLDAALAQLDGTPLAEEARQRLAQICPDLPALAEYRQAGSPSSEIETKHFRVSFSPAGALESLILKSTGREWAGPGHELGLFSYEVFSLEEFRRFYEAYTIIDVEWGRCDLGKVCSERAMEHYANAIQHAQRWTPAMKALHLRDTPEGPAFLAELEMNPEACERFGCPRILFTEFLFPDAAPEIRIDFQFAQKDASRIAEALWFSFAPIANYLQGWRLYKMGCPVDPQDVLHGGNQHLHVVDPGVTYGHGAETLRIDSPDAALCAPGAPALLHFDNDPPDLAQGMHFNLYNNVWGTNFRSWYEEDTKYRFTLALG